MLKKFSPALKLAAGSFLLAAVLLILGGVSGLQAEEVDCGEALNRCLKEQPLWEKIINADYCFIGFLFCLLYMQ
ncbi:MAG: hypothetical protein JW747_02220 [Candidatus Aminicenantes bacterium]|nr:hypothetical protein [Candidatus Aminicenantes bacterium]